MLDAMSYSNGKLVVDTMSQEVLLSSQHEVPSRGKPAYSV